MHACLRDTTKCVSAVGYHHGIYSAQLNGGNHFGDRGISDCVSGCISAMVVTLGEQETSGIKA